MVFYWSWLSTNHFHFFLHPISVQYVKVFAHLETQLPSYLPGEHWNSCFVLKAFQFRALLIGSCAMHHLTLVQCAIPQFHVVRTSEISQTLQYYSTLLQGPKYGKPFQAQPIIKTYRLTAPSQYSCPPEAGLQDGATRSQWVQWAKGN